MQENILATGSVGILTEERKQEISDLVLPTISKTIKEQIDEGKLPPDYNLNMLLEDHKQDSNVIIAGLLTNMAGQHVFLGEVDYIYNIRGIDYN